MAAGNNRFKDNPTNAKILFGSALGTINLGPAAKAIQDMRYTNVLLYDNEQIHIDQIAELGLSERINTIKVGGKAVKERIPFTDASFASYLASLGENTYAQLLPLIDVADYYDNTSGIKAADMELFDSWVATTSYENNRIVLFDWDRTITIIEGIRTAGPGFFERYNAEDLNKKGTRIPTTGRFIKDTLLYAVGGEMRLAQLRAFFHHITSQGVDIGILTNNTACLDYIPLYKELFQDLPFRVYCAWNRIDKGIKGNLIDRVVLTHRDSHHERIHFEGGRRRTRRRNSRRR